MPSTNLPLHSKSQNKCLIQILFLMQSNRYNTRGCSSRPKTILSVYFPNEHETICERFAADTLKKVISKIGIRQVVEACNRDINSVLHTNYVPLVSKFRDEYYGHRQHDIGDGWLVFTGTNTQVKKRQLDLLKDLYHLNMQVAIV